MYADTLAGMMSEPLVVLDSDLKVVTANTSFYKTFHLSNNEVESQLFFDLNDGYWNIDSLREFLDKILEGNAEVQELEIKQWLPDFGYKTMRMNARRVHRKENNTNIVLLIMASD